VEAVENWPAVLCSCIIQCWNLFPHTRVYVEMIASNLSLKKLAHSITAKRFRNLRHFAVLIRWSTRNKRIPQRQNANNVCTRYLYLIIISRFGFHWKCFKRCMTTLIFLIFVYRYYAVLCHITMVCLYLRLWQRKSINYAELCVSTTVVAADRQESRLSTKKLIPMANHYMYVFFYF